MKGLRIVAAVLLLGAAACSTDRITGPHGKAAPAGRLNDGGGFLGGGGRTGP